MDINVVLFTSEQDKLHLSITSFMFFFQYIFKFNRLFLTSQNKHNRKLSLTPPFSSLEFFFGLRNQNFKEKLKQTYCRLTSKCIIKLTHNWCSSSLKAIHNLCNWIHVWNFSNFIIKRWFAEESRTTVLNQSPGKKGNLYNINTCRKLI